MASLFSKPEGVEVGDYYIDIELTEKDEPHPMRRVRVYSIDDTGMITLVAAIAGLGGMTRTIAVATLQKEYRKDEESD